MTASSNLIPRRAGFVVNINRGGATLVTTIFPKGQFWSQVLRRAARARVTGALQPIETQPEAIEEDGIPFVLRVAVNLERKRVGGADDVQRGVSPNPFLPYDPDLFVCDVSPTHFCLLNKFNVVDHHLLIATRHFEHQEDMLTFADFEALWTCLAEVEGIGFYNSGPVAGASQAHKHLQLVPFPLGAGSEPFPFSRFFSVQEIQASGRLRFLPFRHAIATLPPPANDDPRIDAERAQAVYGLLLDAVGLAPMDVSQAMRPSGSYNLLLTRDWIMIVPRSKESFESVSVNALGFTGSLFVRNREELQRVIAHGPLSVLAEVGASW